MTIPLLVILRVTQIIDQRGGDMLSSILVYGGICRDFSIFTPLPAGILRQFQMVQRSKEAVEQRFYW